jgi:hypothetical protein
MLSGVRMAPPPTAAETEFICDWKEEVQPRRPKRNGSMALQIVPTAFQQIEESARPRSPGPERKSRPAHAR